MASSMSYHIPHGLYIGKGSYLHGICHYINCTHHLLYCYVRLNFNCLVVAVLYYSVLPPMQFFAEALVNKVHQ